MPNQFSNALAMFDNQLPSRMLFQPAQQTNPVQMASGFLQGYGELETAQRSERQRKEEDAMRDAIQRNTTPDGQPDINRAVADLYRSGHGAIAITLASKLNEMRKAQINTYNESVDSQMKEFGLASRLAQSALDDPSVFPTVRQKISELPQIGPQAAQILGETFEPGRVRNAVKLGMTISERKSMEKESFDAYNRFIETWQKSVESYVKTGRESQVHLKAMDEYGTQAIAKQMLAATTDEDREAVHRYATDPSLSLPKFTVDKFNWTGPLAKAQEQARQFLMTSSDLTPSLQHTDALLDGARKKLVMNPKTNEWFEPGSDKPIENAAQRIKAIEPTPAFGQTAGTPDDRQSLSLMVADGRLRPSALPKARANEWNAIVAGADRIYFERTGKHFDANRADLEYNNAQKAMSSFLTGRNSSRAQTYRSLSDSVINTIDHVSELADNLKQGGVQLYNRAKRAAIQQVWGNSPQSKIANDYVVAVNTLKEEFANLANGGYAPTEPAWKLAEEQINKDYGFKDMTSSLLEVQRLLRYRNDSFDRLAPTMLKLGGDQSLPAYVGSPEQTTPGREPPAPAKDTSLVWAQSPDGRYHSKPKSDTTPLPNGWRLMPLGFTPPGYKRGG